MNVSLAFIPSYFCIIILLSIATRQKSDEGEENRDEYRRRRIIYHI